MYTSSKQYRAIVGNTEQSFFIKQGALLFGTDLYPICQYNDMAIHLCM